jgi:hypothetical protein
VAEMSLPKRKRTAVDASLTSGDEDSRKKIDVRIENVRKTPHLFQCIIYRYLKIFTFNLLIRRKLATNRYRYFSV